MGFNEKDFVIGIVARLVPVKNHKMLINAFASFCKKNDKYRLIIYGDGELYNNLIMWIKKLNMEIDNNKYNKLVDEAIKMNNYS